MLNGLAGPVRRRSAGRYEIFILNDMMELNEARATLIADIMREGRVYGL